ncbi:plasmalemma vesicle-associated protein [Erythrolamprus reginae]|uniref:plasmalemma vesicle-associated protein n=1 Tax=Erythrolamprus reginae TaxID=121349 RepID=UPI00396C7EF0
MIEKNAYAMATLGLDSKGGLQPKRDCGFYMKYFFLFLSLIEFLIIVALVLFMVYSNSTEATEKHIQGLNNQLQEGDKKIKALKEDIDKLKRQLNATEKESRAVHTQMFKLNTTLKFCNNDKTKLKEQQQSTSAALSSAYENRFQLQLLNITYVAHMSALEKKLVALELKSQMERENLNRESKSWQEKAEKEEKEKSECQLDKLQLQTQGQRYQELKSTMVQELQPALNHLKTSADQLFSSFETRGCYRHEVESTFRSLFRSLQTQVETVGQQFGQKADEVTQANALLQRQKAACGQDLQEEKRKMVRQEQMFELQKQALEEFQDSQIEKTRAECRRMNDDNESLRLQLQQTRQACTSVRTMSPGNTALRNPFSLGSSNPIGTFSRGLGNPVASSNVFSNPNPLGRPSLPAQPSSGSQRNPSTAEQSRFQEILKAASETGKLSNLVPVNPVGQARS